MYSKGKELILLGWAVIAIANDEQRYFVRKSPLYLLETAQLEVELR